MVHKKRRAGAAQGIHDQIAEVAKQKILYIQDLYEKAVRAFISLSLLALLCAVIYWAVRFYTAKDDAYYYPPGASPGNNNNNNNKTSPAPGVIVSTISATSKLVVDIVVGVFMVVVVGIFFYSIWRVLGSETRFATIENMLTHEYGDSISTSRIKDLINEHWDKLSPTQRRVINLRAVELTLTRYKGDKEGYQTKLASAIAYLEKETEDSMDEDREKMRAGGSLVDTFVGFFQDSARSVYNSLFGPSGRGRSDSEHSYSDL